MTKLGENNEARGWVPCNGIFGPNAFAAFLPAETQWTLRFGETRAYISAETGCYGTASYHYVVPRIEHLKEVRQALADEAKQFKLSGYVWSESRDLQNPGHLLALNLSDGSVSSVDESDLSQQGIVFCICRRTKLQNCSQMALPSLGKNFIAKNESPAEPAGAPTVVDRFRHRKTVGVFRPASFVAAGGKSLHESEVPLSRVAGAASVSRKTVLFPHRLRRSFPRSFGLVFDHRFELPARVRDVSGLGWQHGGCHRQSTAGSLRAVVLLEWHYQDTIVGGVRNKHFGAIIIH